MTSAAAAMKALVLHSGQVLFVRILGAALGFVFQVYLARLLGAQGAGVIAIALTSLIVGSVIARVGSDVLALRTAATLVERQEWARLADFEKRIAGVVGSIALILAGAGAWLGPALSEAVFSDPALEGPWMIIALALPPYSLIVLYGELMKGAQRHKLAAVFQGAAIPFASILGLVVFLPEQPAPITAAKIYACAVWIVAVVQLVCWRMTVVQLRRMLPERSGSGRITLSTEPVYRTLLPLYGASLAAITMAWTDLLLLGVWRSASEVGLYNAATRMAMLTGFVLMAVNSIVAPRFAAAQTRGSERDMMQTARQAALLCTGATLPAILIFALVGDKLLSLFGAEFTGAYLALVVLSLGQLANAVTGPVGYLLNMTGHHRIEALISIASAFLNLILCIACIPRYGLLGAAFASAGALTVCNLIRLVAVRRHLGWWACPRL